MKFNKLSLAFGILFGVSLFPLAYISLILGLVLAFSGGGDNSIFMYVFAVLGALTIIASCFAVKKVWVTRIVNTLSTLVLIGNIVFLIIKGILLTNIIFALIYVAVLVLGLLSTIFAWLGKTRRLKPEEIV